MKTIILSIALIAYTTTANAAPTCKSFATQAEAQRYFEAHNAKSLDRDGDGEACECNKGGSREGEARCRKR
jgi:hypothetical protein